MIFVINKLKYDTDKMELISENLKYSYDWVYRITQTRFTSTVDNAKLYRSKKGNWLLTYEANHRITGRRLLKNEAKELLIKHDLKKYEELFGEVPEA